MTDLAASTPAPEAPSTVLEENAPAQVSGGGAPELLKEEPAPSLRDILTEETNKKDGDDPKKEPAKEPAKDGKAEAKEADKAAEPAKEPVKQPAVKVEEKAEPKSEPPKDDGRHFQPPKSLMPDSVEKWTNVPRAVQRDIDSMVRENSEQLEKLQQQTERYESIREFDELAQSNGRDLRDSLTKMSEIEDLMQSNPYAGLNAILQEIGPKKPDGSAPTLFEVAQFISQQGPDRWQQIVGQRPQQQTPQSDPKVEALEREIASMKSQQLASSVIEPFKRDNPRYDELKGDIAMFLKSGKVPDNLSAPDRLAVAYSMAERINPPSNAATPPARPDEDSRVETSSGTKSVKSTPGSASSDSAPKRGGSIRSLLSDEMKRQKGA